MNVTNGACYDDYQTIFRIFLKIILQYDAFWGLVLKGQTLHLHWVLEK